jgi:hypothetical protein
MMIELSPVMHDDRAFLASLPEKYRLQMPRIALYRTHAADSGISIRGMK